MLNRKEVEAMQQAIKYQAESESESDSPMIFRV